MKKIGVFGSAFNPVTWAHHEIVKRMIEIFDVVYIVPSYVHAVKNNLAPYDLRMKMVDAMFNDLDDDKRIIISDIEEVIFKRKNDGSAIFTIEVLRCLREFHPEDNIKFIIGPDNVDLNGFSKEDQIEIRTDFGVHVTEEIKGVRSTLFRDKIQSKSPLKELMKYSTEKVVDIITEHKLYLEGWDD
jgi:nicotinate-nucleotide adenylyltransferase